MHPTAFKGLIQPDRNFSNQNGRNAPLRKDSVQCYPDGDPLASGNGLKIAVIVAEQLTMKLGVPSGTRKLILNCDDITIPVRDVPLNCCLEAEE